MIFVAVDQGAATTLGVSSVGGILAEGNDAMDATLEAKLCEMVDRYEIWDLLLRYSRGLDRLDRDMIRSCYHDDAVDDHHIFVGKPDDFIDWAFEYSRDYNQVHHHGLSNHGCEIDGDDAHSETYYTFIGVNLQAPHLLSMERYIDHFQKRTGEWRIANRVCVIEHSFDLQDSAGATSNAPAEALIAAFGPLGRATRDRGDLSYQRPLQPRRPLGEAAGSKMA
jgi:hypothetical protein